MEHTGDGVGLLMDTGHLSFAGGDPVSVIRRWGSRINHVHCKEVRADVLQRVKASDSSFLNVFRRVVVASAGGRSALLVAP